MRNSRLILILALIAFVLGVGFLTNHVADHAVALAQTRLSSLDLEHVYRFAFALMLVFVVFTTLPLLLVIAYRGLTADLLRAKLAGNLALCNLDDDHLVARLGEYEQRNSLSAFLLPCLINLLLLYLLWYTVLLPTGIRGLMDQLIAADQPGLSLASLFSQIAGELSLLSWAMLGAYFYGVTLIVRRWMLADLTTNVIWKVNARLVATFILGLLLMRLAAGGQPGGVALSGDLVTGGAALAFLIGIVPDTFLRWVGQQVKRLGGIDVEQNGRLFAPSDLQQKIDGMSFWQVDRLAEEGIESVHDLARKEIPSLLVSTRFDPGLLLNWVDRALLCAQVGDDLVAFDLAHLYTATDFALAGGAAAGLPGLAQSLAETATRPPGAAAAPSSAPSPSVLANILTGIANGPNLRHLQAYRANVNAPAGAPGTLRAPRSFPIPAGVPSGPATESQALLPAAAAPAGAAG